MITELYKQVVQGNEVRKNLIELRKLIKDYHNKRAFMYELDGDYSTLYTLLEDEDAKIRKNVALIMGELSIPEFMDKLYAAYEKEEKL
ncbi:MAG: RNA methyltransferase, partial [Peptostreptococcaceae bacterium]|nr:RNA methyltransferase [Peptostreptococcaceae bacterium]